MKPSLTFEEKITVAYLHYVHGVEQQLLGIAMGVNMGRINEACVAVEEALKFKQKMAASDLVKLV